MKALGAHTFGTVWTHDAASAIEALAPLGFRDFQLMAMVPHLDPWTAADVVPRIERALDLCGGRIVAIDLPSSDLNIASTTPAAVEFAVATYAKAMVLGRELGASWLTVNSGRKHMLLPPPDDRLIAIYAAALMRLSEQAQDCGMRILIENIPGVCSIRLKRSQVSSTATYIRMSTCFTTSPTLQQSEKIQYTA